jgi:hypothetical protein
MLDLFFAPRLKIERARKHFAELEFETAAYLAAKPARFETIATETRAGRQFTFILHLKQQPNPVLGAIVGDVIHNLRAALDVAACDLVRWKEGASASVGDIHFPICKNARSFDLMIKKGALNRLGVAAIDVIRDLKPYPAGNPILCGIHTLDVQDKHAALVVTPVAIATPSIRRWDDDGTMNPTLIGDPTAPTELRIVFPSPGPFAGRSIIETLRECIVATESAIERFSAITV